MKKTILTFLLLLAVNLAYSQTSQSSELEAQANSLPVSELKVGDFLPDLEFTNVLNSPNGKIKLSDYRGKLLILDFWATWCAPCVSGFPKLDSLNTALGDKLVILPVTYQSPEEVENLFSRMGRLRGINLPMAVSDNTLRHLFPHKTLPHYVWIDPKGKVIAFTEGEEITVKNIKMALDDQSAHLKKKDNYFQLLNKEEYLFSGNQHLEGKEVLMQSGFMGKIDGLPSGYNVYSKLPDGSFRFVATNSILSVFYKVAYGEGIKYFSNAQIIHEVSHPEKFLQRFSDLSIEEWWESGNLFCYEIIVPRDRKEKAYQYIKEDLARMFPQYSAAVERREMQVLKIIQRRPEPILRSTGESPNLHLNFYEASLKNLGLEVLAFHLGIKYLQNYKLPVVDDTGIDYKVDLNIKAEMSNLEDINRALDEYGLEIIRDTKEIEVLVIKDATSFQQTNKLNIP